LRATRATLEVLGRRLHHGENEHLASQLPQEVAVFLENDHPDVAFGMEELFERVGTKTKEKVDLPEAVHHARAVISVVKEAVSKEQFNDVRGQLPEEYDPLFESFSEDEMK
jgi:uncharacterized protein (DUF2267 family)